jgi:hypothetical protein
MSAAYVNESYNRLFIVANHSEVIYPSEQRALPTNMTVTTLTQMNQTIHVKDGQIPIDMFRHLFTQYGHQRDSRGFAHHVLPTDSDVMGLLSRLSAMGIVYATHNGKRQPCEFRQRKDQAEMTVQMCFLPGALVHSAIYEFSPTHETGTDVSDVILGPKANPGMQLYRETIDKDRAIIGIEKMLMDEFKTKDCPPDHLIIERSHGGISQEDIDRLRKNRENYKNAIQFGDSINEFCSHAIEDVERLREEILQLVIRHDPQLKWVMRYQKDKQSSDDTLSDIFVALKTKYAIDKKDIPALKLTRVLTHNVLVSIYRSTFYSDYKSVTTGHTPIRSDELFGKIREYSGNDNVYVVFIGCRHVPSSDPADLAVMHSPTSGIGHVIGFSGGRKVRRRSVNKPKTRKTSKRIHKKIIINRSHYRSYRR